MAADSDRSNGDLLMNEPLISHQDNKHGSVALLNAQEQYATTHSAELEPLAEKWYKSI